MQVIKTFVLRTGMLFFLIFAGRMGLQAQPGSDSLKSIPAIQPDSTDHRLSAEPGFIDHPLQLIQGDVPGVLISRPGSSPNGHFDIRVRGLNTLINNPEPLYVVDGVPAISTYFIDPATIESIEVVRGPAAAKWGIRGAGGVIHLRTKQWRAVEGLRVEINSMLSSQRMHRPWPVLNAAEYRLKEAELGVPLPDNSASTDWIDAITRTGWSYHSGLSVQNKTLGISYSGNLQWRSTDGIAYNSGYDRLNGQIHLGTETRDNRLQANLIAAGHTEKMDIGFEEAFEYAIKTNPTTPVRNSDPAFDEYGGYYQRPLFDYYNPVAILEQNLNEGERRGYRVNLNLSYDLNPVIRGVSASLLLSDAKENTFRGEFYPPDSYYEGYEEGGIAKIEDRNWGNRFLEGTVNWQTTVSEINIGVNGGYQLQELTNSTLIRRQDSLLERNSYEFLEKESGDVDPNLDRREEEVHRLIAFTASTKLDWKQTVFAELAVRREGSSFLGTDNKWGWFPYGSLKLDLAKLLPIPSFDHLIIESGFGVSGQVPIENGWSKGVYGQTGMFYYNGTYRPKYSLIQQENDNLKWEKTRMFEVGLTWSLNSGSINGGITWFSNSTDDLILNAELPLPPYPASNGYFNIGSISSNGIEAGINADLVKISDFAWQTSFNLSSVKTRYGSLSNNFYSLDGSLEVFPGGAGFCCAGMVRVHEDEKAGQIFGPGNMGIDEEGDWILSTTDPEEYEVIGQGYPSVWFGLENRLQYQRWELQLSMRAVTGHDLASVPRLLYQDPTVSGNYNIIKGAPDNLVQTPQWSDYYVEDGDFLKIDHFAVRYTIPGQTTGLFQKLRLGIGARNLFMITGYSGSDPEVRLSDYGNEEGDNRPFRRDEFGNLLAPGIDRPSTWLNARSFYLSLDAIF